MEELVGKESQDAEHEVQMDFGMTSHPNLSSAELILETSVDSLTHAALMVTPGGRRVKGGRGRPRPFRSRIGRWPNSSETWQMAWAS